MVGEPKKEESKPKPKPKIPEPYAAMEAKTHPEGYREEKGEL
jgi:hypothetical protein